MFKNLIEDYATEPVPQSATYSGWRIGFVLGGIGIAMPALLTGAEIGQALGYARASLAFIVSGALVTTLAFITGWVGMRSRLSTYMILNFSFGLIGARLVNLSFAIAQIGWFGVNAYFFGQAARALGADVLGSAPPSQLYVILGGLLMTGVTVYGYKALDRLALIMFPLMITILAVLTMRAFGDTTVAELLAIEGAGSMSFGQAVTALAGGIIVGVLLVPDLTRYARGPWDVAVAVFIALAVIEVALRVATSGPALIFGETDPLALMLALGFGGIAFCFLAMASVSSNVVNVYGSGLALAASIPGPPAWLFVVISGALGTFIALFDITTVFIDFLVWQSVIFSSVLGVYVIDFFLVRRSRYDVEALADAPPFSWPAILAWALGTGVSVAAFIEVVTLTGLANLDGAIIAGLAYWGAMAIGRRMQRP